MQGTRKEIGRIEMREKLGTGDWGLGTGGRASGRCQFAQFGTHSVPDVLPPISEPPISDLRFPQPSSPRPLPRGITLIEVLISIFVLAVGLLSVSSLFPVASFQVQRSQIDDRKAQVGHQSCPRYPQPRISAPRLLAATTPMATTVGQHQSGTQP